MTWRQIDMDNLEISLPEIYRAMGFKDSAPDAETVRTTELLLGEAAQFLHPQFKFLVFDGCLSEDFMQLSVEGGVTFDVGKIIGRQLRGSDRFFAFVATVGPGWFQWTDALKRRDDVFQTYVADCIGSQIVEQTADFMETVLQQELDADGLHRTNRFSPGYCGWHVSQQPRLFSLFPEKNPCGIELTDSCLMLPVKSVSGIIGVGTDVRYLPYTCHICDMKMCYKRKK